MDSYFEHCERGEKTSFDISELYKRDGKRPWKQNHAELKEEIGIEEKLQNSCSSIAIKAYEEEKEKVLKRFSQFPKDEISGSNQHSKEKHFELLDAILDLVRRLGGLLYSNQWQDPREKITPFYKQMEAAHLKFVVQQTMRRTEIRPKKRQSSNDGPVDSDSNYAQRTTKKHRDSRYPRSIAESPGDISPSRADTASTSTHGGPSDSSGNILRRNESRKCHTIVEDGLDLQGYLPLPSPELNSPDLQAFKRVPSMPSGNARHERDILHERLERSKIRIQHNHTESTIPLKGIETTTALLGEVMAVVQRWGLQVEFLVFRFNTSGWFKSDCWVAPKYPMNIQDFWEDYIVPQGLLKAADLDSDRWYEFACVVICEGETITTV